MGGWWGGKVTVITVTTVDSSVCVCVCVCLGLSGKTTGMPLTPGVSVASSKVRSKPSGNWLYPLGLCKHPRSSVQTYRKARNILWRKNCRRRETLRTTAVSAASYVPSSHASSPWSMWCQSPALLSNEQSRSEEWDVFLQQQKNQALCIKTDTDTLPQTGQARQWGASYMDQRCMETGWSRSLAVAG